MSGLIVWQLERYLACLLDMCLQLELRRAAVPSNGCLPLYSPQALSTGSNAGMATTVGQLIGNVSKWRG